MPKVTRDELFKAALTSFMSNINVILATAEGEDELIRNYCIKDYALLSKTTNKTRVIQNYELTIPAEIIIVDDDDDEEAIWEENVRELTYGPHDVPTVAQFTEAFDEHFYSYRLYEGRALLSYISISNPTTTVPVSDIVINIKIIYHKAHTPFPRPLTEIEIYKKEIDCLTTKLIKKNKKFAILHHRLTSEEARSVTNYTRLQTYFRTLYTEVATREECPVCYEIIIPEKLIVPGCLHRICTDCVIKCDSCPLCRDKYDHYIECDPLFPL